MDAVSDPRRRVLVTGAAGAIGSVIRERLAQRWEIVATDRVVAAGVDALDVTDLDASRAAFAGVDAVVHLAANPDPSADWAALSGPNVQGAYAVAQAARECGLRRLVLASSLHTVSAGPNTLQRRSEDPARPANLYGATKAWAEALGAWVAASSEVSVVALRLGHFAARPLPDELATRRDRMAWLSPTDGAELIRAAVEAELTGFLVVNGVSANRHRIAALGAAEARIGYVPRDDAWAE